MTRSNNEAQPKHLVGKKIKPHCKQRDKDTMLDKPRSPHHTLTAVRHIFNSHGTILVNPRIDSLVKYPELSVSTSLN